MLKRKYAKIIDIYDVAESLKLPIGSLKTMTQPIPRSTPRRGRIFPEIQWTEEEKARRKAESEAFYHRCRAIFERVRPELIGEHYGWYIAVEPDSEEYFIDADKEIASQKARQKYPHTIHCLFCLDESGVCGTI
jgi:hypothetical protein